MPDYKKMYTTLFNAIIEVIEILEKSTQVTEDLYIETPTIHLKGRKIYQ